MTQSLPNAIAALVAHARTCTDIKYAPDQPLDNIGVFPFAVVYLERGQIMAEGAGQSRNISSVIVEFHLNRVLLASAVEAGTLYIEEFGDLLTNDPTLGGTCDAIPMGAGENVTFELGRLEWNGVQTIGVRFHVPVKIRRAV